MRLVTTISLLLHTSIRLSALSAILSYHDALISSHYLFYSLSLPLSLSLFLHTPLSLSPRLPVHIHDLMVSLGRVERHFVAQNSRKPSPEELAERLALPLPKVTYL